MMMRAAGRARVTRRHQNDCARAPCTPFLASRWRCSAGSVLCVHRVAIAQRAAFATGVRHFSESRHEPCALCRLAARVMCRPRRDQLE
jgi:hypothetical protein